MDLVVLMGISGSGKSRVADNYVQRGYFRVCMDELREWYTGHIGDQSQNSRVAEDAFTIVNYLLRKNKNVVWDATSVNEKTRKRLLDIAKETKATSCLALLTDSNNLILCRDRVRKDIENGVNRANTLIDDSIMLRQYNSYILAVDTIQSELWNTIERY